MNIQTRHRRHSADASDPAPTSRQEWAWEFLRANAAYAAHAKNATMERKILRRAPLLEVVVPRPLDFSERWGLVCFERPDRSYGSGTVAWQPEIDPYVLLATAAPADADEPDAVDFRALGVDITVIPHGRNEHVILSDGGRKLQLCVRGCGVLEGPVTLAFHIGDRTIADEKSSSLRRFLVFLRAGSIPPVAAPNPRRTNQWAEALAACPLVQIGLTDDVRALALQEEWTKAGKRRTPGPARGARPLSQYLVGGGYLKILSTANSDQIPGQPAPIRSR